MIVSNTSIGLLFVMWIASAIAFQIPTSEGVQRPPSLATRGVRVEPCQPLSESPPSSSSLYFSSPIPAEVNRRQNYRKQAPLSRPILHGVDQIDGASFVVDVVVVARHS